MSQLLIELYLDEDVDVLLADLLRARGFAVQTTREAHQLGRNDADQLAYAAKQHMAFPPITVRILRRLRRPTLPQGKRTRALSSPYAMIHMS